MSRLRTIRISALNVVSHPHSVSRYLELMSASMKKRIVANYFGNKVGMVGKFPGFQGVSKSVKDVYQGSFHLFTEFDETHTQKSKPIFFEPIVVNVLTSNKCNLTSGKVNIFSTTRRCAATDLLTDVTQSEVSPRTITHTSPQRKRSKARSGSNGWMPWRTFVAGDGLKLYTSSESEPFSFFFGVFFLNFFLLAFLAFDSIFFSSSKDCSKCSSTGCGKTACCFR